MISHSHAAVWLDHQEAKIFYVDLDRVDQEAIQAPNHHVNRHQKGAAERHEHPDDQKRFFSEVARALTGSDQILVMGPSTAKAQFLSHLHQNAPLLEPKIVGLETSDHPTDPQIVAYVRQYYRVSALRTH